MVLAPRARVYIERVKAHVQLTAYYFYFVVFRY